jgi:hypothetical protein
MPKPNPLSQGLSQQFSVVRTPSVPTEPTEKRKAQSPSRSGRVLVGGHFAPEVQTALKVIAAEERTTVQALLAEGINTVLAKRQKPQIADVSAN